MNLSFGSKRLFKEMNENLKASPFGWTVVATIFKASTYTSFDGDEYFEFNDPKYVILSHPFKDVYFITNESRDKVYSPTKVSDLYDRLTCGEVCRLDEHMSHEWGDTRHIGEWVLQTSKEVKADTVIAYPGEVTISHDEWCKGLMSMKAGRKRDRMLEVLKACSFF